MSTTAEQRRAKGKNSTTSAGTATVRATRQITTGSSVTNNIPRQQLQHTYLQVRQVSNHICAPLETEDYGIQTMPDVSPPKWHLAHTSWFFETFLLKPFLSDYREFHPQYSQLFNSYYNSVGKYHPRSERGLLSRPTVQQIYSYRAYIDDHMLQLINSAEEHDWLELCTRATLGINHEQQHQELILADIKHIFACNPLRPKYRNPNHHALTHGQTEPHETSDHHSNELRWLDYSGGIVQQGHSVESTNAFHYDNEGPQHKVVLHSFRMASRPISNQEMIAFIEDGAYQEARLWLSDGWKTVCEQQWRAPLYWERRDDEWWHMSLSGMQPVDPRAPVCHVSFYEADAYARWANKRLPTEQQWEQVARPLTIEGNFRDQDILHPVASTTNNDINQIYGDVWEWTQSPYSAYPGHSQSAFNGFSDEYNSKFMSNQIVLRGGSCATARKHIRPTYRNFFYPADRWQFSGFRLAEDA